MTRQLVVEAPVVGRLADVVKRFREEPSSWLPLPNERRRRHHWWTYLWTGEVGILVDATVAPPFSQGAAIRRLVRLEPDRLTLTGRLAPALEGDLVVRPHSDGLVVRLEGTYKVPLGPLGAAANAIFLHKLGEASVRRFVTEVAARLGGSSNPDRNS